MRCHGVELSDWYLINWQRWDSCRSVFSKSNHPEFRNCHFGYQPNTALSVSNTGTGSLTVSQLNISGSELSMTGMVLPLALSQVKAHPLMLSCTHG